MVFLVRKLRTDPELRRFKVVVVTDRKTCSASSRTPPR
jgi:type I restriction enzyme, R subunit